MNLSVGIVGLPNVGKSTLFNALLKRQVALAANYPFATIEPNVGVVPVPDIRLEKLAEVITNEELDRLKKEKPNYPIDEAAVKSPPIIPAAVEFVDIAGLVKGAAEGAGLGNKFLSHIREVSVICHVVRAFEDTDVIREGSTDPKSDYETITAELILSDLQTLEKLSGNRKAEAVKVEAAKKLAAELNKGKRAHDVGRTDEEEEAIREFFLLTSKPEMIVLNVSEDQYTKENIDSITKKYAEMLDMPEDQFVVICAKIESELASLSNDEQREYLKDLGLEASGLERLIQKAYDQLGLISFLTAGEKEVRAWTIKKGIDAQHAAGEIHTDFIKKFIKAEVVSLEDYVELGGRKKAREVGKARLEGKDYTVQDGDVIEFKIGS